MWNVRFDKEYIPAGKIYAIYCPSLSIAKIGMTTNLKTRFENIRHGCPYPVEILTTINVEVDVLLPIEKYIHKQLGDKRINGEWFAMSKDEVLNFFEHFSSDGIESIFNLQLCTSDLSLEGNCVVCKKPIKTAQNASYMKKYCSGACKQKAYRERNVNSNLSDLPMFTSKEA